MTDNITLAQRVESFDEWLREGNNADVADLLRDLLARVQALERKVANEGELLRWFSDRLTGGNAGTWDEVKHAFDGLEREVARRKEAERELAEIWESRARYGEDNPDDQRRVIAMTFGECAKALRKRLT